MKRLALLLSLCLTASLLAGNSGSLTSGGGASIPTTSEVLKGDGVGGAAAATQGVDYLRGGYTTTVAASGTTTLTVSSTYAQYFTGAASQNVVLPVTSTLYLGFPFLFVNNSSGSLQVKSSGANAVLSMGPNTTAIFSCILTSGTGAASWNATPITSADQKLNTTSDVTFASIVGNGGGLTGIDASALAGTVQQAKGIWESNFGSYVLYLGGDDHNELHFNDDHSPLFVFEGTSGAKFWNALLADDSSTPTSTATPHGWIKVKIADGDAWIPYYQ